MFRHFLGWTRGYPTHDIKYLRKLDNSLKLNGSDTAIILCQNEKTRRVLWEIGYMLLNLILQAKSLDIFYESKIFKNNEFRELPNAVAALIL